MGRRNFLKRSVSAAAAILLAKAAAADELFTENEALVSR